MTIKAGLVVSGDTKDAQAAVDALSKKLDQSDAAFERQAAGAKEAAAALNNAKAAAGGFGGALGQGLGQGGGAAAGGIRLATHELTNLQFQMQDISQGLLTGQSPFRVILQQGSQIVQLFGPRAGLQGALRAVGGAFVTYLTNPLNIALLSFAAAAGAVQFFVARLRQGAEAAEDKEKKIKSLKEAVEELDKVSGRANKTHEEELRIAEATVKQFLEQEVATRKLIAARLEFARAQQQSRIDRSRAPGVAADISGVGVLQGQTAISNLTKQLEEQEKKIAEAEASLRGATADRIDASVDGALDQTEAITQKFDAAENALRGAFEAGKHSAAEYETQLTKLRQERQKAIDAVKEAERADKDSTGTIESARKAVENLLATQQRELAILRETDPVKAELIRHSKEYAAATAAERKEIEANIAALQAAKTARDAADERERNIKAAGGAIDNLQLELDLLRESDPVQRELIRLRTEMAGATDEQQQKIKQLAGAIELERASQDAANDARELAQRGYENLARVGVDALTAIADKTRKAGEVLRQLVVQLVAAGAQALLLGQGPLGGLFGGGGAAAGGGLGGLFGKLFGGAAAAFTGGSSPALAVGGLGAARGGYIDGPGTETSDSIPARLSKGEFVINAAATKKNRPLLEAINDNRFTGYARGGYVSRVRGFAGGGYVAASSGAGRDAPGVISVNVTGARGNQEVMSMVEAGVRRGIAEYDSSMPLRVRGINADPRFVG